MTMSQRHQDRGDVAQVAGAAAPSEAYLLSHLLEQSAARFPDRPAVVLNDRTLSYAELAEAVHRLAGRLRHLGVRRGDRVGIYLPKSIESVISLLGILDAGGVYVPLDANSPPRRIAYIIKNCRMRVLISARPKLDALATAAEHEGYPESTVVVDGDTARMERAWSGVRVAAWPQAGDEGGSAEPASRESDQGVEDDLAYILYTSGSTGEPKGVMLSHRHAMVFIQWAVSTFAITAEDRLSNHAPLHFDLSILDIFCAIKTGGAVVLVPEGLSTFPIRLAECIQRQAITIWYSVPSALILLLQRGQLGRFSFERLRTVLFAGEVFPVKYLRSLMAALPHAAFYNLYGPTETNVCTYYRVPALDTDRVQPIPIGKACANAEVFALTEQGRLIQDGEEGELYVRGPLVMNGYWGDPARTERVVVGNPLQSDFPERLYRTGDIVTLDQDGNYLLVGRRDHMIKSRGYRIELGEIETTLYAHPLIKEAAAVPIPDEQFGNRIKACVVPDPPGSLTEPEIKKFCADRLPSYMVPEFVTLYSALPRTSTGKVDRKRLTETTPEPEP